MPESSIQKREQRLKLCVRQRWLCHWCRNKMRWVVLDGKGTLPQDAATLDHLDDRWSPERGAHPGEFRRVAACRKCNESRSNERMNTIYREQQKARSTNGGRA